MAHTLTTLCYLVRDGKALMLHRTAKENDINKGKWIGVGGHVEEGESPDECARREIFEETGFAAGELKARGVITFVFADGSAEYTFLYTCADFEGAMHPCDEGELAWVELGEIEKLELWEGDRIFLKLLSDGAPYFSLKLTYDAGDALTAAVLDGSDVMPPR